MSNSLSAFERISLINQNQILKALSTDTDEKERYDLRIEALYDGFVDGYFVNPNEDAYLPDELSEKNRQLAWNLMSMYYDLGEFATDKVHLRGFDGHTELAVVNLYLSYLYKTNAFVDEFEKYAGENGSVVDLDSHGTPDNMSTINKINEYVENKGAILKLRISAHDNNDEEAKKKLRALADKLL